MEMKTGGTRNIAPAGKPIRAVIPAGASQAEAGTLPFVKTRNRLLRTRLGRQRLAGRPYVLVSEVHPSLAARRNVMLEARRSRRWLRIFLIVAAVAFPPLLAVYFIAWLILRTKPHHKSMRRVRQAVHLLEREQVGMALHRLQEAHLLDPSSNDALYWLGLLLTEQRRYSEAVEALSIVSERVPGLPEVEAALAEGCNEIGDYESAIHHAQLLLDLDPYDLHTLVRLADSFEATGRVDLAIETLLHAPLYKRTLDDALKLVHYRLGELYERTGQPDKAHEHYRRVQASDISFLDTRAKLDTPALGEPAPE